MRPVAVPPGPLHVMLLGDVELIQRGLLSLMAEHRDRVQVHRPDLALVPRMDLVLLDPFLDGPPREHREETVLRGALHSSRRWAVYTWRLHRRVDLHTHRKPAGYLAKGLPATELVADIEKICSGQSVIDDVNAPALALRHREVGLTMRETDMLAGVVSGRSNAEIAAELGLSPNTVKTYVRSAYRRIGVTSRSEALLWAVRNGFRDEI